MLQVTKQQVHQNQSYILEVLYFLNKDTTDFNVDNVVCRIQDRLHTLCSCLGWHTQFPHILQHHKQMLQLNSQETSLTAAGKA